MIEKFVFTDPVLLAGKPNIAQLSGDISGEYFYPTKYPYDSYHISTTFDSFQEAKKELLKRYKRYFIECLSSIIQIILCTFICIKHYMTILCKLTLKTSKSESSDYN